MVTRTRKVGKNTKTTTEHFLKRVETSGRQDFGAWYGAYRHETAYSYTTGKEGGKLQGPHTFAHIGKRAAAELSIIANSEFDPLKINRRSGVLPSPGQARKLLAIYESQQVAAKEIDPITKSRKRKLDEAFRDALGEMKTAKTKRAKDEAAARAMELNPLATYSHGKEATSDEIKGKGEKRDVATRDVMLLGAMKKGTKRPALSVFDPGSKGFEDKYVDKYLRDIGRIGMGDDEDLSDLELSSADEYSDDEG